MKQILVTVVMGFVFCGCTRFCGGLAGGAVGAGAGYEMSAHNQLKELDADLKAGRIDQKEYEIRRSQIERGSVIY